MKRTISSQIVGSLVVCITLGADAFAATKYELTVTNGSQMPLSPGVIYARNGEDAAAQIGKEPTAGFIQLCQMGNASRRFSELRSDSSNSFAAHTMSPILPGESSVVIVEVLKPEQQSIHFETMYGKTKDVCGIASFNSHSLVALKQHVTTEIIQKDSTLLTGAFSDPAIPDDMTYLDPNLCATAQNAISCLRELAMPVEDKGKIRFFSGYFTSVLNALEMKYSVAEVQPLLFPVSGAIRVSLKLVH